MLSLGLAEDPRAAADPRYAAVAAAAALLAGRLGETGRCGRPAGRIATRRPSGARRWPRRRATIAKPVRVSRRPCRCCSPTPRRCGPGCCRRRRWRWPRRGRLPRWAACWPPPIPPPRSSPCHAPSWPRPRARPRRRWPAMTGSPPAATARPGRGRSAGRWSCAWPPAGSSRRRRPRRWRRRCSPGAAMRAELESPAAPGRAAARLGDGRGAWRCCGRPWRCFPTRPRRCSRRCATASSPRWRRRRRSPPSRCSMPIPALLPADARGEAAVQMLVERLVGTRSRRSRGGAAAAGGGTGERRRARALGLRLASAAARGGRCRRARWRRSPTARWRSCRLTMGRIARCWRRAPRRGAAGRRRRFAALRALGPAGGEALSELLAEAADWPALRRRSTRILPRPLPPPPAPLGDPQRRLLLRQAALLALAGDDQALAALRGGQALADGRGAAGGGLRAAHRRSAARPGRPAAAAARTATFRYLPSRLEALRAGAPVDTLKSRVQTRGRRQIFGSSAQIFACVAIPLAPYAAPH